MHVHVFIPDAGVSRKTIGFCFMESQLSYRSFQLVWLLYCFHQIKINLGNIIQKDDLAEAHIHRFSTYIGLRSIIYI